ncbi:MAG: hypothetical protein HQL27_00300 [Candidatus Omnitrophica bacterium]|nr:hypothetical protein [Candidatus Omnitrophota bacterium]
MSDKSLICNLCNGEMQPYSGPRHSRKFGGVLIVGGVFSSLFFIGPVLGIPLLIMGLYMTGSKRQLWVCKDCNTAIERIELKPEEKASIKKD